MLPPKAHCSSPPFYPVPHGSSPRAFVVPLGSHICLLNGPPAAGLTPWSASGYRPPRELKFHSDHFSPLLKQPSVAPCNPQDRVQRINSFHMQDHRDTFPPTPWERSGSLNTRFIFWSFRHCSHCSLGTECPCPIFTWQNPTLHLRPSSDVASSKKSGLLPWLKVATPFSAFPRHWDSFL